MRANQITGIFLILLGVALFFREYIPLGEYIKSLWPAILIIIGATMVLRSNNNSNNN